MFLFVVVFVGPAGLEVVLIPLPPYRYRGPWHRRVIGHSFTRGYCWSTSWDVGTLLGPWRSR